MQILCQMLRSFNGTIDAEIAESKVSARMQLQQRNTNSNEDASDLGDDKISQPDEDLEQVNHSTNDSKGHNKERKNSKADQFAALQN